MWFTTKLSGSWSEIRTGSKPGRTKLRGTSSSSNNTKLKHLSTKECKRKINLNVKLKSAITTKALSAKTMSGINMKISWREKSRRCGGPSVSLIETGSSIRWSSLTSNHAFAVSQKTSSGLKSKRKRSSRCKCPLNSTINRRRLCSKRNTLYSKNWSKNTSISMIKRRKKM